ncbi:SH3 domain-containing protein [Devosia sp.]|uniref:SH3 domain-containing protein n=1 Tax=Devosia sp. TaxID=1871048 RepID=UPI00261CD4C4|nr:SH3 domain-containing protein [Devosia sp.]
MLVAGATGLFNNDRDAPATSSKPTSLRTEPVASTPKPSAPLPDIEVEAETLVPKTAYVKADTLNVRASPSTGAAVLGKLTRGTAVVPRLRSGEWYGVILTDGSTGWMHGDYLAADLPAAPVELIIDVPPKAPSAARPAFDRDQVVDAIIKASLRSYSGACPCPYNTMRSGRRCGGNSAYSKPGGRSPICYPGDVSERMIADYINRN